MEEKLHYLFDNCINELNSIGIDTSNLGEIDINISNRSKKRYGCCKQENPDKNFKTITRSGFKRVVKYEKFNKHKIEISAWVLNLNEDIIKNTIMHEIIHCFPYCNNHGIEFKKYAKIINNKLGYNIARVGNKQEDYQNSNIEYNEKELYKYKIECKNCGQIFYRKRYNVNLITKYRCGICKGKLSVKKL